MNNIEIINTLINMNNSFTSTILPWQTLEICRAKLLDKQTDPTRENLAKVAKTLNLVERIGCVENAKYFCFLPSHKKKWKVFLVDRFNRILGQLEDYEGEIKNGDQVYCEAFLIELK